MPESIELTDIFLRIIGAFYAFAGFVATRAAMTSHFLERAIAAITMKRTESAQTAWLTSGAALVLAGGVLLLAGLQLAAWAFIASALGQAAYIFIIAPRVFDVEDPPDAQGRRQTTNAFVIYLAATAFIVWAAWRGRLTPLDQATATELGVVAGALLLYGAYIVRTLWWTPRSPPALGWGSGLDPDAPSRPLHDTTRVKVMADYGCDPLWTLDEDLYGCFSPRDIKLSDDLCGAFEAWAAAFETSIAMDDPSHNLWSEDQHAAHKVEGRRLAERLKRERPDLMVYVLEDNIGVVEVHADGRA
ncbi:MAG: hypothetical protein WC829_10380 [Hyphomicrobium sp.]